MMNQNLLQLGSNFIDKTVIKHFIQINKNHQNKTLFYLISKT